MRLIAALPEGVVVMVPPGAAPAPCRSSGGRPAASEGYRRLATSVNRAGARGAGVPSAAGPRAARRSRIEPLPRQARSRRLPGAQQGAHPRRRPRAPRPRGRLRRDRRSGRRARPRRGPRRGAPPGQGHLHDVAEARRAAAQHGHPVGRAARPRSRRGSPAPRSRDAPPWRRAASRCISARVSVSRLPKGSSSSTRPRPGTRVRASATRWRMPPDSSAGSASRGRPGRTRQQGARRRVAQLGTGRLRRPWAARPRPRRQGTALSSALSQGSSRSAGTCRRRGRVRPRAARIRGPGRGHRPAVHPHLAAPGRHQARQGVQQRALAAAAAAHHGQALAGRQVEGAAATTASPRPGSP